jgi:Ser-tRNA(Ala) deacylase AlaX
MFNTERSFSNHIEKKKSKCDYYFDRNLEENEISELQNEINRIIKLNLDISESIMSVEEASKTVNLDRMPDNFGEEIRVIRIGDYDTCPCSGTHVKNTNEVGQVKIVSTSFDDNVLRVRFKLIAE